MEELTNATTDYLLEIGIEELHRESETWDSRITLWKRELDFFQKLLDTFSSKFDNGDDRKSGDHFQNLIIYYNGELLEGYKQAVRRQKKNLGNILSSGEDTDEATFRNNHIGLKEKIDSFDYEFRKTKQEFFNFIESKL
jgi:hypothetical protein